MSSIDPVGEACTEPAQPAPAETDGDPGMPERAIAIWQARIWGQPRGHVEELQVTPAVLGAAADGKLTLTTLDGEPIPVPRVQRPARPAVEAVRPPSARKAARAQAAARRQTRPSSRTGRRGA